MPDVQGCCPACGAASLFLGEGGHVTCARIECSNPCAADDMLRGGEEALAQALGGDRTAHIIGHNLNSHGCTLAHVRRMTDKEFLGVPGIGHTSLRRIRRAFPVPGKPRLLDCGFCYEEQGEEVHPNPECATGRAARQQPPAVATARIHVDVTADPSTHTPRCSCGQTTRLLSVDSAGAHWHEDDPAVPVPLEAFDRLVRVAMWVSRGQAMAHVPDPQISGSYPDAAARYALGALDDAGLLNTYREKTSGRPTHPDGTPYRYHEIVAGGWSHCDGCRTWGQGRTAENPHDCPGTYVKGPKEAPRES
ncbi:hypothetical protein [Streptomyces sp. CFMR 7]|uniref:hypothetical protein n=1 Tax=Streptomyces sp. CFMR 7 TaxID=1649184 RepID=UPI0011AACBBA|nr:hypothetical protein [Streptomyces sp. CFMR 7]